MLHRVMGILEPITGDSGHKAGDTVDVVSTHHKAHSHTMDNLMMLISLKGVP